MNILSYDECIKYIAHLVECVAEYHEVGKVFVLDSVHDGIFEGDE